MKFDMHCHTKEGSPDGSIPIEQYISILKKKGFGGMVISDHNSYNGYRNWKKYIKGNMHTDFVVLKGIEYDTIDAGHFLIIMPETLKIPILELRGLPILLLIEIVHRYGGIIGPTHPCGERYLSYINTKKRRNKVPTIEKFDFIESFNACEPLQSNREANELAKLYQKPGFGGSDAHRIDCIGMAYTNFPETITSESELIRYVKSGAEITCGGELYRGTTKEKIGFLNHVLLQIFWVYNKTAGLFHKSQRSKELKKKDMKKKIEGIS